MIVAIFLILFFFSRNDLRTCVVVDFGAVVAVSGAAGSDAGVEGSSANNMCFNAVHLNQTKYNR